jgi:hypothetical protein
MRRAPTGVLLAVLLFVLGMTVDPSLTLAAAQAEVVLTVDPAIRDTLASLRGVTVLHKVKRIKMLLEIPSSKSSETETWYEPLGQSLWGAITLLRRVDGTGVQQHLTVCGIFDAISTSTRKVSQDLTASIPIGRVFVPFTIKTDMSVDSSAKLTKLVVDPTTICLPAPGAAFAFQTSTARQLRASPSIDSSPRTFSVGITEQCKASERLSASSLKADLRGDYLDIICSGVTDSGKAITKRFAFLLDSGIYLLLEEKAEAGEGKYTILSVEYEG